MPLQYNGLHFYGFCFYSVEFVEADLNNTAHFSHGGYITHFTIIKMDGWLFLMMLELESCPETGLGDDGYLLSQHPK